jgi:transposase-like protein
MQQCRVCEHPEQRIIDIAIAKGNSLATLARRHDLSEDALSRHRAAHTDGKQDQGIDPGELLAALLENKRIAEELAATAEEHKDRIAALREVRQSTDSIARLTGASSKANMKNLIPFWAKLKNAILEALKPYPDARRAVLDALEKAELGEA